MSRGFHDAQAPFFLYIVLSTRPGNCPRRGCVAGSSLQSAYARVYILSMQDYIYSRCKTIYTLNARVYILSCIHFRISEYGECGQPDEAALGGGRRRTGMMMPVITACPDFRMLQGCPSLAMSYRFPPSAVSSLKACAVSICSRKAIPTTCRNPS